MVAAGLEMVPPLGLARMVPKQGRVQGRVHGRAGMGPGHHLQWFGAGAG